MAWFSLPYQLLTSTLDLAIARAEPQQRSIDETFAEDETLKLNFNSICSLLLIIHYSILLTGFI